MFSPPAVSLIFFLSSFRRRVERPQRAAADQRPHVQVQQPGEAGPQRVGAPGAQVRPHPPADHRRGG